VTDPSRPTLPPATPGRRCRTARPAHRGRLCFDRALPRSSAGGAGPRLQTGTRITPAKTVAAAHELAPAARDTFSAASADAAETA